MGDVVGRTCFDVFAATPRDAPIEWGDGDRDGDLDLDSDSFIRETERWNSRVAYWRSSCLYRISNYLNSTDAKIE